MDNYLDPEIAKEMWREHKRKEKLSPTVAPEAFLGYVASGIPIGIAANADLPAFLANQGLKGVGVAGIELPERFNSEQPLPYAASEGVTKYLNKTFGEPQGKRAQGARNIGEFIGGFAGPGGASLAGEKALVGKGINKVAGFSPQKYEQFNSAGITPNYADVSTNKGVKHLLNKNAETPGGAGEFEKFYENRGKEIGNTLTENLNLKEAKVPEIAGETVKQGGKAYNAKVKEVGGKLYDRAWEGVPEDFRVDLSGTAKKIDEVMKTVDDEARQILESSGAGKELLKLKEVIEKKEGKLAIKDIKHVYKDQLKTINKAIDSVGTEDKARLKQVIDSLTKESNAGLAKEFPQNAKDLAKADKFWEKYSERNRDIANNAATQKKPVTNFNATINALKQGSTADFRVVAQRLPKNKQTELTASVMNKLGQQDGNFDPYVWAKEYNKLPKESQRALSVGLDAKQYHKINELADILKDTKATAGIGEQKFSNLKAEIIGAGLGAMYGGAETAVAGIAAASTAKYALSKGVQKAVDSKRLVDGLYAVSKVKTSSQLNKVFAKYAPVFTKYNISKDQKERPFELTPEIAQQMFNQYYTE